MPPTAIALTLDEIVFADRNRAYGAFVLRQQYRPTLLRAVILSIGLLFLAILAPALYARLHPTDLSAIDRKIEVTLLNEPPVEATPPVVPPAEMLPMVATIKFLPPVVVPAADAPTDETPPAVEELQRATAGAQTQTGSDDALAVIQPPETTAPTAEERAVEAKPRDDNEPFINVEQQPEFPGGMAALQQFLSRTLRYPSGASQAGVSGRVFVSFVVGADGRIADVSVLKGIGFGCDEEATRVIRAMPVWKPGKQSGRAVRVRYNLPISFALE